MEWRWVPPVHRSIRAAVHMGNAGALPLSRLGTLDTQNRVGSRHQSSQGNEFSAFATASELFVMGRVQNIANAFQSLLGPVLLCHRHFLGLHGIDATQSTLLSLVELNGPGHRSVVIRDRARQ